MIRSTLQAGLYLLAVGVIVLCDCEVVQLKIQILQSSTSITHGVCWNRLFDLTATWHAIYCTVKKQAGIYYGYALGGLAGSRRMLLHYADVMAIILKVQR